MLFYHFYMYLSLASFDVTRGIWILFLQHRGFSLAQIGLAESIFHLTSLLCEVPSGYLADRIGRKHSLYLGALCRMAGTVLIWWAPNLAWLFPAFILSALSYVFPSGADRALLYELNARLNAPIAYTTLASRAAGTRMVASSLGLLVGGALAARSYDYAYGMQFAAALVSILPLLFVPEPARQHGKTVLETMNSHANTENFGGSTSLISRPMVLRILAYSTLLWSGYNLYHLIMQPGLAAKGAGAGLVSVVSGLGDIAAAIGSLAVVSLAARWGRTTLLVVIPMVVASEMVLLPRAPLAAAALLHIIGTFWEGVGEPVLDEVLNHELEDEYRATLLSVQSALSSGIVVVGFPLAGWLFETADPNMAFGLPLILAIGAALVGRNLKRKLARAATQTP